MSIEILTDSPVKINSNKNNNDEQKQGYQKWDHAHQQEHKAHN